MVTSDFLSEIERELGLLQVMNDALPTRQNRIVKRIRELRAAQQSVHPTNGGLCAVCNKPANHHEDHDYVAPLSAISG